MIFLNPGDDFVFSFASFFLLLPFLLSTPSCSSSSSIRILLILIPVPAHLVLPEAPLRPRPSGIGLQISVAVSPCPHIALCLIKPLALGQRPANLGGSIPVPVHSALPYEASRSKASASKSWWQYPRART